MLSRVLASKASRSLSPGAANVHYLTGRTFSGWVREAGLQAGEQVRMKKEGGRVLIQRVPADRKVRGRLGMGGGLGGVVREGVQTRVHAPSVAHASCPHVFQLT